MMRPFELRVTDADIEQHNYRFWAPDILSAVAEIPGIMAKYGHTPNDQVSVCLDELVRGADMSEALNGRD